MTTSGLRSAIHFLECSNPPKSGCQYGSSDFPLSSAAPIAGTCEVGTPATILAMLFPFRLAAVALDRAAAFEHHLGVVGLRLARHQRGDLLEREAVARGELGRVVNVPAKLEHPVPVPVQDRLRLLRRHRKLGEVRALVGA